MRAPRVVACAGLPVLAAAASLSGRPLAAQQDAALRGRVVAAATGAPIGGVTIFVPEGRALGVTTGATGAFRLRVARPSTPTDDVRLVAARLGFAPETLTVRPGDGTVVFRLREAALALSPALVRVERSASVASSSTIRALDIQLRPRASSQELLRLVPGLVIAQHAGGGKAEQIFLRGFDADHGTDVALSVDGVPVNMVTHAHGQGYADLHFLLPDVVERVDARKGPFDVRDGDFATAGAVAFRTRDRIDAPTLTLRGGSFGARALVAMTPLGGDATQGGGYVAAALQGSAGPFLAPQDHRRLNAFAKWTTPVGRGAELVASASTFGARWDASGQVPDRAVRAGALSRFGAVDPTEGGRTSRHDLRLALRPRESGERAWEASAFAARYRFGLFSNFTFFNLDSVRGDGIEQVDDRVVAGASASYGGRAELGGAPGAWSVGVGTRLDAGDVALHHQQARRRLAPRVDVAARQAHLYQWARYELAIGTRVRADVGVRADAFRFAVTDRLAGSATPAAEVAHASGTRWQGIVSPRANLAVDLPGGPTLYASAGSGFHSNDARDVVAAGAGDRVLPRAISAELGARQTWSVASVAASAWVLDLESELVYVGDEGVTEPSGRSRRMGVDVEARVRLAPWLWADADVTLSRGRFRDEPADAARIPLAPTRTATAGLTVRELGRLGGGLRARHVGSRPAVEDNSVRARGYTVWELFASYQLARVRVYGAIDNLLGAEWNEAQFATTSRLRGEAAGITDLHFTPGTPRALQLGVDYRF